MSNAESDVEKSKFWHFSQFGSKSTDVDITLFGISQRMINTTYSHVYVEYNKVKWKTEQNGGYHEPESGGNGKMLLEQYTFTIMG